MSILSLRTFATGLTVVLVSSLASAQQFQYQVGMIPGTPQWTEGLESADVDNDGDLDIFFAEGDGFSSAGTKRQNTLVINKRVENGILSFTNESVARLGVHVSNAKGVATGDINGDGWVDAVFANAFNTDRPFLYENQGAGNPGFFNEVGNSRGLTEVISSASAGFGDLDDDGDLDLVLNDSGNSYLGGAGDKPVLYINDGSGNFTEKTGVGWNPASKIAQMDVQLVDVDNDWDLDFVGYCRGSNAGGNHYLMLNDGSANFTEASSLLPNGSTSCYESEIGDLDGDNDLDVFMVSLSGFNEGMVRNNFVESGSTNLTFTALTPLSIAQDDNEIAFMDYDNDGDLDAFVGSLGSKERLWRNNGNQTFTNADASIQTVSDSTLDCHFADLDNDGDYDFITAQGESNAAQFVNKVYLNSGPADTLAPTLTGELAVAPLLSDFGPWVALAKIQDAVVDDGVTHVSASAHFCINANATQNVTINAGNFAPANLNVVCGDTVSFLNSSGSGQTVKSTTAPWTYNSGNIPNGGSFEHSFVRPGVYAYSNASGSFGGTITVTGSASSVLSTYSGGGLFRSMMSGDASATGAQLVYELQFTDWAGNVRVSDARAISKSTGSGMAFCDGSGGNCPCGGMGAVDAGCPNSNSGAGATLVGSGNAIIGSDSFALTVTNAASSAAGLILSGKSDLSPGIATIADSAGLLCVGTQTVRGAVWFTNFSGFVHMPTFVGGAGYGAASNVMIGTDSTYTFWYRDPNTACAPNDTPASDFNFSNGWKVTWN